MTSKSLEEKDLANFLSDKNDILDYFYECYYNTAQDTADFAEEFYNLYGMISFENKIPCSLDYLSDWKEGFFRWPYLEKYIK